MIAEIVSNGMLSLPSALAVVGASLRYQFIRALIFVTRSRPWDHFDRVYGRVCSIYGETPDRLQNQPSRGS
jgi:hypothetical protein